MPRNILLYLLFSLFGFFLGSIMFSLILPRHFKGVDVRQLSDDGNPGTANAVKYGGVAIGMLCLAGDLLKAALPVYLARRFCGTQHLLFALVMASPVLGHAFSPFLGGKGGKAIAPAFGALVALLPEDHSFAVTGSFLCVLFSGCCHRSKSPEGHRGFSCPALFTACCSTPIRLLPSARIVPSAIVIAKHWRPLPLRRGKRVPFWQAETRAEP